MQSSPPSLAAAVPADAPDWPDDFARRYRDAGYWQDTTFFDALAVAFKGLGAGAIRGHGNEDGIFVGFDALEIRFRQLDRVEIAGQ